MATALSADKTAPAVKATAVTASDVTVLAPTRALYIGTAGNLNVTMADGAAALLTNVGSGIFPISVTKVLSTSTTATGILAMY